MEFFYIACAVILNGFTGISGQIYLTTDVNPIQGKPFTFVCRTTTLSKTVTFFDPQGRIAGSCLFPEYICDSGYNYKLSQNISSALRTFLTIENLNRSLHQGSWRCIYGQERAQMNLSVMTFPDRVHLEGLQTDVDLSGTPLGIINITCSCSCSYPDAMIGLSLVVGKSEYPLQSYTYKKQSIDTNYSCTDPLENAYTSQFSLNIGIELPQLTSKTARLKCNVTVSAVRVPVFGMSVGRIIFPDSSTTSSQGTKTTPKNDTSTSPPQSAQLQNENETNVGEIDLASENNAIQGKQFTFICTMTTLSRTVTFFDPQSRIAGSCIFPEYVCGSGYGYKLSQNVNTLRTFLTIDNLNRTLHQGIWKCVYGQEQARMNLSVITLPDRVNLEGLQNDVNVSSNPTGIINVTCSCSCSYPDAMFGLSLVVGNSEYLLQSYTYQKQSLDPSYTCADQLENAYTSQLSLNILSELPQMTSMTARLRCYVTVSAVRVPVFGMSVGRIIFPDSSTPTQGTKTTPPKVTTTTPPQSAQLQIENGHYVGVISLGIVSLIYVMTVIVICYRLCGCAQTKIPDSHYKLSLIEVREGNNGQNQPGSNSLVLSDDTRKRYKKHLEERLPYYATTKIPDSPYKLSPIGTRQGNNGQSQPGSNSLVLSDDTRNNLKQLSQNLPEGIRLAFIEKRVTKFDRMKITDKNVVEVQRDYR